MVSATAVLHELPVQVQGTLSYEDGNKMTKAELVQMVNFRNGYIQGQAMRLAEADEKFDLALDYQREVDALLVEKYGEFFTEDGGYRRLLENTARFLRLGEIPK